MTGPNKQSDHYNQLAHVGSWIKNVRAEAYANAAKAEFKGAKGDKNGASPEKNSTISNAGMTPIAKEGIFTHQIQDGSRKFQAKDQQLSTAGAPSTQKQENQTYSIQRWQTGSSQNEPWSVYRTC